MPSTELQTLYEKLFGPYPKVVGLISDELLPHYLGKPHLVQFKSSRLRGLCVTATQGLTDKSHLEIFPKGYKPPPMKDKSWFGKPLPNPQSAGLGYEMVFLTQEEAEYPYHVLEWLVKQQLRMECDFAHHLRYGQCVTSGPYGGKYIPPGAKVLNYIVMMAYGDLKGDFTLGDKKFRFALVTNISDAEIARLNKLRNDAAYYSGLVKKKFDPVFDLRRNAK